MAERTPQSGGRGIRRVQPPTRLTYDELGNPSNFQQTSHGAVGCPQGQVAGVIGDQVAAFTEGQVAGVIGDQVAAFTEGQVAGVIGDQVAAFTEGQVAGVIGDQVAAVTKSQAAGASGGQVAVKSSKRAKSVVTNSSSASVRLRQNELEAKKKSQALKETLAAKREELRLADSELFRAKGKLEALKKRNTDGSKEGDIADLEIKIIDLQANFNLLAKQVDAMEASTADRLIIIQEEKELNAEIIMEEESSKNSSVHPEDKHEQIRNWIHDADFAQHENYKDFGAYQPVAVPQQPNNDMVTQLVTALGQAFGSQQHSTIVTKQVDKDLPIFTGKPEDWLTFKSEYERTSWKYKYDDSENTVRLRKFVKGPAKESINHLLANPFNATKVMETLERRFGNPQFVLSSLIEKAKSVRSPDVNKPESIVDYGTAVDVLVTNIVAFQMSDYLNNIQLLSELVEKLPAVLRRDWYRWIAFQKVKENLQSFQTWLSSEVDTAIRSVKPQVEEDNRMEKGRRHHGFNAAKEETDTCACCKKSNHKINACYTFKKMKIEDRWKIVRDAKLCFQCLEGGHMSSSCPSSKLCGIDDCGKSHHQHLHHEKRNHLQSRKGKENPAAAEVVPAHTANMAGNIARPLMSVKVIGPLGTKKVLALLDMGCSFTAIEEDVAKQIGLEVKRSKFTFEVFKGRKETEEKCGETSCKISGVQRNAQTYQLKEVKTMGKLGISGNPLNMEELKRKYPHLRQSKATSIPSLAPQMVIGYDNFRLYHSRRAVEGTQLDHPSAHQCRLGWYICTGDSSTECFYACESCQDESDKQLHYQMKEFFAIETSGMNSVIPSRSKDDAKALAMLEQNTKKVDGRWETSLLWKEDNPILPESKWMALRRLQLMEKKMARDPDFCELVQKKFDDYLEKGYLVPATPHQNELEPSPRKWYLPWFFAYHPTKKPRLVYDAAAKVDGKSLNDFLLKGPDLLNSLPAVLMRFRQNKIALTGDIREMFHQVKLRKEDWPSQTILFRGKDRNGPPQEYYMTVLFFGAASSPCSAIYAKNKNADLFRTQYPAAVEAIHNNFYMDDYLGSTSTEEEAMKLRKEITIIHEAGGFQIVKWNSNSQRVLDSIPPELRAEQDVQLSSKSEVCLDKTLGMWWSPSTDNFQFKVNLEKIPAAVVEKERRMTKREVTSVVMSLFDPLGFLAPVKIKALIVIQNIWKSGIAWDDELTPLLESQWNAWLEELEKVKAIKVPRKMTSLDWDKVDMHIFVDASEEAYSSSCYLLFFSGSKVEQCFVFGKARVSPIKGQTIPRMELEAALTGSRISSTVKSAYGESIKINSTTFWSDSKTVLCWLRSQSGRFKIYVQTRVGEILENSEVSNWRWISTKQNVADDATRSKSNFEFNSSCRWLTGVKFLLENEANWPKEEVNVLENVKNEDLEIRHAVFNVSQVAPIPLPEVTRFSSWMRLIRATAAVIYGIRKFKKVGSSFITVQDMQKAEIMCMLKAQQESFTEEVAAAKVGESFGKTSRLRMFTVGVNEDGLLVLRGRIDAAVGVDGNTKRPILLDPKHPYTQLWIQWLHQVSGHHGQERVIAEIRKTAWILDCRNAVRRCWATCPSCKLRKLQPLQPEMGQLPICRLGEVKHPFYHTGVDLFGPLSVRVNRSIQKRWGIIFTCMSTRAVYLDLVESLEAAEVVYAIARFASVRGSPCHIWSDNGTNFVKANKELKLALKEWNQDNLQRSLSVHGIQWHFNPPAAPHMGGSWERLIGCAKNIMMTLLKSQAPRESILRTVLYQAADILNGRPLTYASTDPDDPEVITPNHLLKMNSVDGPIIPGQFDDKDRFRRSWKYAQFLADEFWRRWTAEYIPTLLKREKWIQSSEPIKEGDVVFLVDDLLPRSSWKKAIVTATFPGKDGVVRVVDLRVALGDAKRKEKITFTVLRRPVRKIVSLGLNSLVTGSHWEGENVPAQLKEQWKSGEPEEKTGGSENEREK